MTIAVLPEAARGHMEAFTTRTTGKWQPRLSTNGSEPNILAMERYGALSNWQLIAWLQHLELRQQASRRQFTRDRHGCM